MRRERTYQIVITFLAIIILAMGIYQYSSGDKKIATIGNVDISEDTFVSELKRVYGKEVLDEMINKKVVYMIAEKNQITVDEKEVTRQYDELRKGYSSEDEFVEYLRDQMGWTKNQLLENIKFYILWEEIATKDVVIEEEQIQSYYDENVDFYTDPESFHIEQIIVTTLDEANQLLSELNNGSNFNTLAKELSMDVLSASNGGDIGFVSENDYAIDAAILKEAGTLELNEISSPIELDEGYAVIRVIEYKEETQIPLEEVKGEIRRELALKQVDSLPEILKQLKEDIGVEVYDSTIE